MVDVPPLVSRAAARAFRWRQLLRRAGTVRASHVFARREATGTQSIARYRLRSSGLLVHVRHGTGDIAGLEEIFVNGNYDPPPEVATRLACLARDHRLRVADLGGNIGLFPLTLFHRFPTAQVVSFEPDPANARVLDLTRRANGRQRDWELVEACAGAAPGQVRFLGGQHMESRLAAPHQDGTITVAQVDVLDRVGGMDWLKIDIEGGEWEILADPRFTQLAIPVLALEYHPQLCPAPDPRAAVTALLTSAGYRIAPYEERSPGLGELWAYRG